MQLLNENCFYFTDLFYLFSVTRKIISYPILPSIFIISLVYLISAIEIDFI